MTLEEKINVKMNKYYQEKKTGTGNPVFKDGAYWMRDELLPVMKEMKEALESDSKDKIIAALEKYNALFEDKQK